MSPSSPIATPNSGYIKKQPYYSANKLQVLYHDATLQASRCKVKKSNAFEPHS